MEWNTKQEFMSYLKETLIPDLKESGSEATAEDFETALEFMEDRPRRPNYLVVVYSETYKEWRVDFKARKLDDATNYAKEYNGFVYGLI